MVHWWVLVHCGREELLPGAFPNSKAYTLKAITLKLGEALGGRSSPICNDVSEIL